jgi:DNA mismatch repair ATPase MutS
LKSLNAKVVIATHDLIIGELEQKYPETVINHCFEVELVDEQLIFDYKLKKGVSKKLNAWFLMKRMGIIGN